MIEDKSTKRGILSLTIKDKLLLYASYMPFIDNGGLFITTEKPYAIGEEIFLLLSLMNEPEKIPILGKVVWVTPVGAQNNRSAGIGIQFVDNSDSIRTKIEVYLATVLQSDRPTHTL